MRCDSRHIVRCPVCGRKGFERQYRDGSSIVIHTITRKHGLPIVTDHCTIRVATTAREGRSER